MKCVSVAIYFFLPLSDRMATEPRCSPSVAPSTSGFSWSTADCTLLGAGWGQQPSPAMQVHPHSATVQSWTGLGEQQDLEKARMEIWVDLFLFSVAFWSSVSMNRHNSKFKKAPLCIFLLRTPYSTIHITYRDCILIPFHIAHQKTEQPHCRNLSTEMWIFSEDLTHIPCLAKPQLRSSSDAYEGHPHKYFLTLCFLACAGGILGLRSWHWGTVQGFAELTGSGCSECLTLQPLIIHIP